MKKIILRFLILTVFFVGINLILVNCEHSFAKITNDELPVNSKLRQEQLELGRHFLTYDTINAPQTKISIWDSAYRYIDYDISIPRRKDFEFIPVKNTTYYRKMEDQERVDSLHWYAAENAWRLFCALNWPINEQGNTLDTLINGDYVTRWDQWPTHSDIFVAKGSTPSWTPKYTSSIESENFSAEKNDKFQKGNVKNLLSDYSFVSNEVALLEGYKLDLESDSGKKVSKDKPIEPSFCSVKNSDDTLYDQNANAVRYTISYEPNMYDFLVDKQLYKPEGQDKFLNSKHGKITSSLEFKERNFRGDYVTSTFVKQKSQMYFPIGARGEFGQNFHRKSEDNVYSYRIEMKRDIGSIVLKTSWKVISEKEKSRFHTKVAMDTVDGQVNKVFLGLVGMHIGRKARKAPTWIWATFEHVDNCPEKNEDGNLIIEYGKSYSFFNTCSNEDMNTFLGKGVPAQIVRETFIEKQVVETNKAFHTLIKQETPKSIWLNYKLIGVQWPKHDRAMFATKCHGRELNGEEGGSPFPEVLANSTIEPFIQKESSCYGCHVKAMSKQVPWRNNITGNSVSSVRIHYDFMIMATKLDSSYKQVK